MRHNPATYYTGVRGPCRAQDVPLRGAQATAAFTFVTPNLCHDMHSCPVQDGDRWLASFLPRLLRTSGYRSGSTVVFITWDEDDGAAHQHIPTLVVSPDTRPGTRSATAFDHYSMLATTEDLLGLPRLGRRGAGDLDERGVRAGLNGVTVRVAGRALLAVALVGPARGSRAQAGERRDKGAPPSARPAACRSRARISTTRNACAARPRAGSSAVPPPARRTASASEQSSRGDRLWSVEVIVRTVRVSCVRSMRLWS